MASILELWPSSSRRSTWGVDAEPACQISLAYTLAHHLVGQQHLSGTHGAKADRSITHRWAWDGAAGVDVQLQNGVETFGGVRAFSVSLTAAPSGVGILDQVSAVLSGVSV